MESWTSKKLLKIISILLFSAGLDRLYATIPG
jgi:hypothetical protein